MDELFAVVAIEAQRHRADVVGEDLGTVDDGAREAMERSSMRRTYVAEFAVRRDQRPNHSRAPPNGFGRLLLHPRPAHVRGVVEQPATSTSASSRASSTTSTPSQARAERSQDSAALAGLAEDDAPTPG